MHKADIANMPHIKLYIFIFLLIYFNSIGSSLQDSSLPMSFLIEPLGIRKPEYGCATSQVSPNVRKGFTSNIYS